MRFTVDDVRAALDDVVDPCASAMGVPIGLVDMGLVAEVQLGPGRVDVTLRLTSPCCAYGPQLAAAAAERIGRLAGRPQVAVTIDHAAEWRPSLLSARAAAALDGRRRRTLELTDVRPYAWST